MKLARALSGQRAHLVPVDSVAVPAQTGRPDELDLRSDCSCTLRDDSEGLAQSCRWVQGCPHVILKVCFAIS